MRVLMLQIIEQTAPPRPRCFDSHREWVSWLHLAHESGLRITRRHDRGGKGPERHTWQEVLPIDDINYCVDCTSIHRSRMERADRCERALAERAAATQERAMQYEGIARAAHNIHRAHRTSVAAHDPAGPAWESATTKERNAVLARCESIHKALNSSHGAADIGEDAVFFETVRYLLPAFQAVDHAKKHVEMVAQASEEEQIGALLYITAMVRRFGGETGTVSMTRQDMESAVDYELMRHDEEDGGLILKVDRKEPPVIKEHQPVIVGAGSVALDLARAPNE